MAPFPITALPELQPRQYQVTLTLPRISTTITTIVTLGGSNPTQTPDSNPEPHSSPAPIVSSGGGGTSNSATIGAILGSLIGFLIIMVLLWCCCTPNSALRWGFWRKHDEGSIGSSYYSYEDSVSERSVRVGVRGGAGSKREVFGWGGGVRRPERAWVRDARRERDRERERNGSGARKESKREREFEGGKSEERRESEGKRENGGVWEKERKDSVRKGSVRSSGMRRTGSSRYGRRQSRCCGWVAGTGVGRRRRESSYGRESSGWAGRRESEAGGSGMKYSVDD